MRIKNNCRKATFLIEKKYGAQINVFEKLELAIHLLRCPECKVYKSQSATIDRMLDNFFETTARNQIALDQQSKNIIQEIITKKLRKKEE